MNRALTLLARSTSFFVASKLIIRALSEFTWQKSIEEIAAVWMITSGLNSKSSFIVNRVKSIFLNWALFNLDWMRCLRYCARIITSLGENFNRYPPKNPEAPVMRIFFCISYLLLVIGKWWVVSHNFWTFFLLFTLTTITTEMKANNMNNNTFMSSSFYSFISLFECYPNI